MQTRGVFDALGLAYEVKRVDPEGLWKILAPWGPVSPRSGSEQEEPVPPPWPDFAIASAG